MFSKRRFLALATVASLSALAGLSPAWAAGGNDPIGGIDIIIKKNPGSYPIAAVPFGSDELAKLNALAGGERPSFVLQSVAAHTGEGDGFVKSGMVALGEIWCASCKMDDRVEVKFRDGEVTYTLGLTFRSGEVTRPARQQGVSGITQGSANKMLEGASR
jgi:hypothetical protein